jgi:hypothetical protein
MKRITPNFRAAAPLWPLVLLLTTFGAPCFAQAPITNGLVARWTGDGNAKDSTGHFDGTVSGGLTYVPGPKGQEFPFNGGNAQAQQVIRLPPQAFQFNGGDAKVEFGKSIGNFGTRDFTVVYWMKTDSKNPHEAFLAKRTTCDGAFDFWDVQTGGGGWPYPPPGTLVINMTDVGHNAGYLLLSSHPLNDGQWHHIAWVRESTSSGSITCLIYVDGALDNSNIIVKGARDNPIPNPDAIELSNQSSLILGHSVCECCDGIRPYTGAAAELQLFSHALTAEEILAIYNAGKPVK